VAHGSWSSTARTDAERKQSVATLREARELKVRRRAERAAVRRGPTLQAYALDWVDDYAGRRAHDAINDRTRREYRRLLITYAFEFFDADTRLADIDDRAAHAFVEWLCRHPGPDGRRLTDRSLHNAVMPPRACLRHAASAGLIRTAPGPLVMPRRRRGRGYGFDKRRVLTHDQLAALLAEIPDEWRPFDLLASTGLRISEAIALRIIDIRTELDPPRVHVRRAIVAGHATAPKSRHARRTLPLSADLGRRLEASAAGRRSRELLFVGARGAALRPGNLRYRVLNRPPIARVCRGHASTPCATPALRC